MTNLATIALHLREIIDLHGQLHAQALHGPASTSGDIPGGRAVVELALSASPETWANKLDGAERAASNGRRSWPEVDDDDTGTVLWTLRYWSEGYRDTLGMSIDDDAWKPTVASEARFLAMKETLDHIWEAEAHVDDLAADVATCKRLLEDVLHAGERPDRTRIVCPDCEDGRGLIRMWGDADEDSDRWKCPGCKHKFDATELTAAHARQMRSEGTERWIPVSDAISVLKTQGEREATARDWFADAARVETRDISGRREVWWPDVWRAHLESRVSRAIAAVNRERLAQRKTVCAVAHGDDCWQPRRGCSDSVREITAV
jgi:hypothetical protein